MLKAYIVDDERLAVRRLTRLLEATGRIDVAGSTTDPEAAVGFLRSEAGRTVDVLFLDIQMPGLTGFELLERLDRNLPVIFTTAFDKYALDAFNVSSIDYLMKPIEADRLDRALDKLERFGGTGLHKRDGDPSAYRDIRELARELAAELRGRVSGLAQAETRPRRPLQRIASRVGERTTLIDVARVTHFFAKDKLTFAVAEGRERIVEQTLSELDEGLLDPRRFVRIHRATIVNTIYVQELFPGMDGGVLVRLKDEKKTELSVARDRVRELKLRLGI